MQRIGWVGTVLLATACGGRATDVQTRSGDVAFAGTTAYFLTTTRAAIGLPDGGTVPINLLQLDIHASADGCGPWQGVVPPARSVLAVSLIRPEPTPITPGRYSVSLDTVIDGAWVLFTHQEPAGGIILPAVSGQVDLARLSETAAAGSVDVTLQDGSRLEGDFSASPCP